MKNLLSSFAFALLLFSSSIGNSQINVTMSVNTTVNRNAISPYVYGANEYQLRKPNPMNLSVNRMGGNRLTGYNWENNFSNAGTDWQNASDNWMFSTQGLSATTWQNVAGSGGYLWADSAFKYGSNMVFTLQAAGSVSADGNGSVSCTAPCNRWVPVSARKPGGNFVYPPSLTDNAVYMDEYLSFLIKRYGKAYQGGIKFNEIDNEPDLWNSTHPLIWGTKAPTATQVFANNLEYAKMIKDMDSSAQVVGFGSFGVYGWESLIDIKGFLKKFKMASDTAGKRLLDVVDVHIYPEHKSTTNVRVCFSDDATAPCAIARAQAPRSLWDSSFVENSWVPNGVYGGKGCMYIKRLKSYIDQNYPGTKLSITEWLYGAANDISGGVSTADVLGIYGREGVYLANYFGTLTGYASSAFKLFRNYDGKKSTFGDISLQALTNDNQNSSIYAASVSGSNDKELHLIVINKSNTSTLNTTIKINSAVNYITGEYYGFDGSSQNITKKGSLASISGNSFALSLPAFGVYHVVLMSDGNVCASPQLGTTQSICGNTNIELSSKLTATNRVFTWYKDGVQITGQTSPNLSISQAGTYKVSVDSNTCIRTGEVIITGALNVNLGADVQLCTATSAILDAGNSTIPNIKYQWNTGETSVKITVSKPSLYSVTVSAVNCPSVSGTVTVSSNLLNANNDTICSAGMATLSVVGKSTYSWYTVSSGGTALASGNSYTPTITTTQTYYVEDAGGMSGGLGKPTVGAGSTWALGAADMGGTDKINNITVTKALTLQSVAVYVVNANTNVTINIKQGTTVVKTVTVNGNDAGKQTINLNANLQPGSYTIDAYGTNNSLTFEASGASYPYSYPGYISFTYNASWQNVWYGLFYDWKISAGSACVRTPVSAVIDAKNAKCGGNITQTISLTQGWNLISFSVSPADKSIENVFKSVLTNVDEIKTFDSFWKNGQIPAFNSLNTIKDGTAYLVKMKASSVLTISATPVTTPIQIPLSSGWNLLGCPIISSQNIVLIINTLPILTVKNFEGFWLPSGSLNSISTFDPGKGYFIKTNSSTTITY